MTTTTSARRLEVVIAQRAFCALPAGPIPRRRDSSRVPQTCGEAQTRTRLVVMSRRDRWPRSTPGKPPLLSAPSRAGLGQVARRSFLNIARVPVEAPSPLGPPPGGQDRPAAGTRQPVADGPGWVYRTAAACAAAANHRRAAWWRSVVRIPMGLFKAGQRVVACNAPGSIGLLTSRCRRLYESLRLLCRLRPGLFPLNWSGATSTR